MATGKFFQSEGREADVTRAITRAWADHFDQMIQSEVLVVGAGPSGLCCAYNLARQGLKVVVIEQCNHLGGGFWNGGYMSNKAAIRKPADRILEELRIPLQDAGSGIILCDPPHATAALIAACYAAGAKFLNLTVVRDVVWRENRLEGLVVNYAPIYSMPQGTAHVDPIPLEAHIVVDATGHDAAVVNLLAKRNICAKPPGNGAMWIEESEEEVVKRTGEYLPNLWICGLSVAAVHGTPRMGPAFGGMLLSGQRAAEQILVKLRRPATPTATQAYKTATPGPAAAGVVQVKLPPVAGTLTPIAPTKSFGAVATLPPAPVTTGRFPGATIPAPGTPVSGTRTPSGMQPAVTAQVPAKPAQTPSSGNLPAVNSGQNPAGSPSNPPSPPVNPPPVAPPDPGIPTVNPETNRWMRGSTSRFFKKKP
ncbi:MAG: thiamine biosynthetic [Planctomycetota bacterium]|nr:MAG: thiamine biosynthetic [Planctomycetota bacterium]